MTQVQQAVTDHALGAADLLVSAQTGSGKTVGFGLAIAPTILDDNGKFAAAAAPLALVIAPTRELALQVKRELGWLYGMAGATLASCVGGMDMRDERRALARGAHIVVATPGRLRDHVMRGSIDLGSLRAVVLDEADEMLDLGFQEDLEFILNETPKERRTLLFSATVPRGIADLAQRYQRDAVRVTTAAEKAQHSDIEYHALTVAARDGENAIVNVLRFHEAPNALVFANTRATVNRLTTRLGNRGFAVVALSGELSQAERTHALQAMRDGRARVCVATDVAARGIDLPGLDLVIHAELPNNHETLLHRSGRTGRAGRKGVSALIVPPAARRKCERLLKSARLNANWSEAPSADAVRTRDEERMLADPIWEHPLDETDAALLQRLTARYSAEHIAAACLHLFASRQSPPEDLLPADTKAVKRERAPFGPSVWFSINSGRTSGADPGRLLAMLCREGDITRDDVGAIRMRDDHAVIELRESAVAGFLDQIGPDMTLRDGEVLSRLDKAPDLSQRPAARDKGRPRSAPTRKTTDKSGPLPEKAEPAPAPSAPPAPQPVSTRRPEMADPSRSGRKPRTGVTSAKPKRPARPEKTRPDGVVTARKPRPGDKAPGAGGKGKSFGKPGKGPKPPIGKPTSKKNRARAAAKGGQGAPTRRAIKPNKD
nr:DEAD/DEAH box helicase [Pontibaca salina]